MSEKQLKIKEVEARVKENDRLILMAQQTAGISQSFILNYTKRIEQIKIEHKKRIGWFERQLKRVIKKYEDANKEVDRLIEEKETIHTELKAAIHLGEILCEYCKRYFTPQGFGRHKNSCSMKPAVKTVKNHEKSIVDDKIEAEKRKAEIQEELAKIDKKIEEL